MTTNVIDIIDYYAELLVIQYIGAPRAYATIQTVVTPVIMPQTTVETITFPLAPTSGQFVISYGGASTPPINWNDSAATIQAYLRALPGDVMSGGNAFSAGSFSDTVTGGNAYSNAFIDVVYGGNAFGWGLTGITVTGSIASLTLTVIFNGVTPPADLLNLVSTSLLSGSTPVTPVITEIDEVLPLAVQNAYNLTGPNIAQGVQLDVLGKYVGVTRTGGGFSTPITLDDADFLSLIQFAIIRNNSGSSLAQIDQLLFQFFGFEILVFDYQNMRMSYLVSSAIGSQSLIQLVITEGLLPRPMGVQLAEVIYAPVITTFFGFRTYLLPAFNTTPFNSYADYLPNQPWLSYANAVIV